jgi:hypothetical protein
MEHFICAETNGEWQHDRTHTIPLFSTFAAFVRAYLARASSVLGPNLQPFLNSVDTYLDGQRLQLPGAEQNRSRASIMALVPQDDAYLVNNLPEFLRHAEVLHPSGVAREPGLFFYSFWLAERDAALRQFPSHAIPVQPARSRDTDSNSSIDSQRPSDFIAVQEAHSHDTDTTLSSGNFDNASGRTLSTDASSSRQGSSASSMGNAFAGHWFNADSDGVFGQPFIRFHAAVGGVGTGADLAVMSSVMSSLPKEETKEAEGDKEEEEEEEEETKEVEEEEEDRKPAASNRFPDRDSSDERDSKRQRS